MTSHTRGKDKSNSGTPANHAPIEPAVNRKEEIYPFISNDIVLVVKVVNGKDTLFLRQIDPKISQTILENKIGDVQKPELAEIVKKGFEQLKQEIVSDVILRINKTYYFVFQEILKALVRSNYSCRESIVTWILELFDRKDLRLLSFIWTIMGFGIEELFQRDARLAFTLAAIQNSAQVSKSVELAKYPEFKHKFKSNEKYEIEFLASNPAAALFPEYVKIFKNSYDSRKYSSDFRKELKCRIALNMNAPRFPEYWSYIKLNYYDANHFDILQLIATNPGAVSYPEYKQLFTIDFTDAYLNHTSFTIRRMILTNPAARSLPEYADLIPLEYGIDLETILKNPDVRKYPEFQKLFRERTRWTLAQMPEATKFPEFKHLFNDNNRCVLSFVAANPEATKFEEYLQFFTPKYWNNLEEERKFIAPPLTSQIAKNPNAVRFPEFRRLFSEPDNRVKISLAGNPNATQFPEYEQFFEYLHYHDSTKYNNGDQVPFEIKFLYVIAENPKAIKFPKFSQLFSHPNLYVRARAANNPNAFQSDEFRNMIRKSVPIEYLIRNKDAIQFPEFKAFLTKPRRIRDPSKVVEYYEFLGYAAQREDVADLPEFKELLKFLRFFVGDVNIPDPMVGIVADAAKHPDPSYPQEWKDLFAKLGFDPETAANYDPDQELFADCLRLCAMPPVMDPRWITNIFAARKRYKAKREKSPLPFPAFLDNTLDFFECLFPIIKGLWHNPKITQFEEYKLFSKIKGPLHDEDYFQKRKMSDAEFLDWAKREISVGDPKNRKEIAQDIRSLKLPDFHRLFTDMYPDVRYEALRTYYNHLNEQFRRFDIPPNAENTPKVQTCEKIAQKIDLLKETSNTEPEFTQFLTEILTSLEQANLSPIPQAIITSFQQIVIPKETLKKIEQEHNELASFIFSIVF